MYRLRATIAWSTVFGGFIIGCTGLIDGGIVISSSINVIWDGTNEEYMEHGLLNLECRFI